MVIVDVVVVVVALTVDKIVEPSDDDVWASALSSSSVRIEVNVSDGFRDSEASDVDGLAIGVDDVHVVGVALVQADARVVTLEQRSGRVQSWNMLKK